MKIALRIDVDTFRGTKEGVPELCRILDKHGIRAAFFFSVGPDNMGRHLWRLFKPAFLWKMLRTRAASLYGWDILFMGTMWQGPQIGMRLASEIRACSDSGHEIGVHAWDHHAWQAHIDTMSLAQIENHLQLAYDHLSEITGKSPDCSAVPGWRCEPAALAVKEKFNFRYNSDCRGSGIFIPEVEGRILKTPQMPLNMPTYDELLGKNGVTNENYNERLLSFVEADSYNMLTIHAEAEGRACSGMFEQFLEMASARGIEFCAPGDLLPENIASLPVRPIVKGEIPGREGWVALKG
ncbi:MAG: 4-deoxy-4-formamido-L-arabinose-phosphoundecaprenol deformylase [Lentisphaeria bacterium]|nr:4-deoxy-4-formamido-L-arabinose-phosphoundecaprenol deformylase [Lentisphaeria bacterium]